MVVVLWLLCCGWLLMWKHTHQKNTKKKKQVNKTHKHTQNQRTKHTPQKHHHQLFKTYQIQKNSFFAELNHQLIRLNQKLSYPYLLNLSSNLFVTKDFLKPVFTVNPSLSLRILFRNSDNCKNHKFGVGL